MGFIIAVVAKLLDPVGFIVVLVVSFISRAKWIMPISATIGAVTTETILASTQVTRSWGQGLVQGLIASGVHALICYWLIGKFRTSHSIKESCDIKTSATKREAEVTHTTGISNPIDSIAKHLKIMGYDFTPYGASVALIEVQSGYNEVETASHIALTTMALDIKEVGTDIVKLASFIPHAHTLLEILKNYKDQSMMNPTQWQNDANAILRISSVDNHQEEWLEKILGDPIAGKDRLAKSRIIYEQR